MVRDVLINRASVLGRTGRPGMLRQKFGCGLVCQPVESLTSSRDRIAASIAVIEGLAGMLGTIIPPPARKVSAVNRHSDPAPDGLACLVLLLSRLRRRCAAISGCAGAIGGTGIQSAGRLDGLGICQSDHRHQFEDHWC